LAVFHTQSVRLAVLLLRLRFCLLGSTIVKEIAELFLYYLFAIV
jgi:hypothetical protein